jgi:hypothetical protein
MEQLTYRVQKVNTNWQDETGVAIPFNRLSKLEKIKEQVSGMIIRDSLKINKSLTEFKGKIEGYMEQINNELYKDKKRPKDWKGNFTFYNFDRTLKIEVNINETIRFDDALISSARECLDEFIKKNVTGTDEVVRALINSAFHNTKGGLDAKKVLSLMKYRTKIKAAQFQEALNLIEQSISRDTSKKYFRVWAKDTNGQYQNIDLNFSSI